MRNELGLHRFVLGMLVALLAMFVFCFLYLNSRSGYEHLEALISLVIVILVATMFGVMGIFEGMTAFDFGLKHRREVIAYLAVGILSAASALYLVMSPDESLQRVALVAAPQALLLGLAELRMGRHIGRHPRERRALTVCGVLELLLGTALVWGSTRPNAQVAELLGAVAFLTFIQLLSVLLYREIPDHQKFVTH